jgi:hypothetical protein
VVAAACRTAEVGTLAIGWGLDKLKEVDHVGNREAARPG